MRSHPLITVAFHKGGPLYEEALASVKIPDERMHTYIIMYSGVSGMTLCNVKIYMYKIYRFCVCINHQTFLLPVIKMDPDF